MHVRFLTTYFLGHISGCVIVKPLEESKITVVKSFKIPKTKEARTFLGMTGYYQRFIKKKILK